MATRWERCSSCGGRGQVQVGGASRDMMPCGYCGGSGKVPVEVPDRPETSTQREPPNTGCLLFLAIGIAPCLIPAAIRLVSRGLL